VLALATRPRPRTTTLEKEESRMKIIQHRKDREPAVGACNRCGAHVTLSGFTNTCRCGADYNMSGQELADRSQWGEETGESVADILSVDCRSVDDLFDGDY
jgi:hypothetical protein